MKAFKAFVALIALLSMTACADGNSDADDLSESHQNDLQIYVPSETSDMPDIVKGNGLYIPDFSYAGYKNGNAPLPKVSGKIFNVTDYGAVANDGKDDSQATLKALEAANAHNGPVILKFPAGRFILSDIIYIERSDFALQGEGEATTLYYPRPMKFLPTPEAMNELAEYLVAFDKRQREKDNNIDLPFSLYAWSGGYIWTQTPGARGKAYLEKYDDFPEPLTAVTSGQRGDLTVTAENAGLLQVGQVLKIEWYNRQGENGSILTEMYGDRTKFKTLGSHHWNYPRRALVSQMTRIEAIDGNLVTLSDPLLLDANPDWEPAFVPWDHLENVSISDLNIEFPNGVPIAHHVEDGYNAMYLTGLFDSFVRNVTIINADSGILNDDNANLTLQNITTKGPHRAHYTVHMGSVYNVLADNIRVENEAQHPLSFNTYAVKSVYKDSEVLKAPLLDQHSGANHQNLFDNIKVHLQLEPDQSRVKLFDGGGAGYWKPSHGRFSTFYNIEVAVTGGDKGSITLTGPKDGVQARILGVHGNREFLIEYAPDPHIEQLNQKPFIPSLYDYQLDQRRGK
jgi:hypothetical protein